MKNFYIPPAFEVLRDPRRCVNCKICVEQCPNGVHSWDEKHGVMLADESKCVDCQRCVAYCPTHALKIEKNSNALRENANWHEDAIQEIWKQAATGGVLLSSMGSPKELPVYWDRLLVNASQVTNPPIDPLREPMETRVFLGKKPERVRRDAQGNLITDLPPQLELSMPVMFAAMSYGAISFNAHESLARAAEALGICYNTGEGGLHEDLYRYGRNTITQVASGRFGVHEDYLMAGAAIEIKMGQGAKPGIGGIRRHFPGTPPRYLFHRGSPAADLLLKGSDTVPETGDRQGSRGPQHRGHRQRHCAGRRGHHCYRRLPGRHRRRAHPNSRQCGHSH